MPMLCSKTYQSSVIPHPSPRAYDEFVTLAAEDLMCAPLLDNFFLCSSLHEVCLGSAPGIIHTYTGGCGRTNSAGFSREAEAIPENSCQDTTTTHNCKPGSQFQAIPQDRNAKFINANQDRLKNPKWQEPRVEWERLMRTAMDHRWFGTGQVAVQRLLE